MKIYVDGEADGPLALSGQLVPVVRVLGQIACAMLDEQFTGGTSRFAAVQDEE